MGIQLNPIHPNPPLKKEGALFKLDLYARDAE
jgi:hypothetical protein